MQGIKKLLVALPVILVLMFLLTGVVNAEAASSGTVKGDSVNVRATPETSAKVLLQLYDGMKVTVLEAQGDWYKVVSNDTEGWVFGQYLTVKDAQIAAGTVQGNDVNVRSKPDTSSEVLTRLDKGAKVVIFESNEKWYRIQIAEGRFGWISRDYVAVSSGTVSRGVSNEVKPAVSKQTDKDTDIRQQIVAYAKKFLGVKYVYGGSSPKGFDCSGFVQYVFSHFNIKLERSSDAQGAHGTKLKKSELKPGDLVFFDTNGGLNHIEHVGIYIGSGKFIHASSGSSAHKVIISELNTGFYDETYMTSRRYVKDAE